MAEDGILEGLVDVALPDEDSFSWLTSFAHDLLHELDTIDLDAPGVASRPSQDSLFELEQAALNLAGLRARTRVSAARPLLEQRSVGSGNRGQDGRWLSSSSGGEEFRAPYPDLRSSRCATVISSSPNYFGNAGRPRRGARSSIDFDSTVTPFRYQASRNVNARHEARPSSIHMS